MATEGIGFNIKDVERLCVHLSHAVNALVHSTWRLQPGHKHQCLIKTVFRPMGRSSEQKSTPHPHLCEELWSRAAVDMDIQGHKLKLRKLILFHTLCFCIQHSVCVRTKTPHILLHSVAGQGYHFYWHFHAVIHVWKKARQTLIKCTELWCDLCLPVDTVFPSTE